MKIAIVSILCLLSFGCCDGPLGVVKPQSVLTTQQTTIIQTTVDNDIAPLQKRPQVYETLGCPEDFSQVYAQSEGYYLVFCVKTTMLKQLAKQYQNQNYKEVN